MYLAIMDVTFTRSEWDADADGPYIYFPKWASMPGSWEETSSGDERTCKFVAKLTAEEWAKLCNDWSIDPEDSEPNLGSITEYGHLEALAFNWDGEEWNVGGWTPIEYITMYVSEID